VWDLESRQTLRVIQAKGPVTAMLVLQKPRHMMAARGSDSSGTACVVLTSSKKLIRRGGGGGTCHNSLCLSGVRWGGEGGGGWGGEGGGDGVEWRGGTFIEGY